VIQAKPGIRESLLRIRAGQSDEHILRLHDCLASHRKVRWKDSIKLVLYRHGRHMANQHWNQAALRPPSNPRSRRTGALSGCRSQSLNQDTHKGDQRGSLPRESTIRHTQAPGRDFRAPAARSLNSYPPLTRPVATTVIDVRRRFPSSCRHHGSSGIRKFVCRIGSDGHSPSNGRRSTRWPSKRKPGLSAYPD
jgi:hypothetical protein